MKRIAWHDALVIAFPAALVAACATAPGGDYAKPYALLQTESRRPMPEELPAFIIKIDGREIPTGHIDPVDPGMREVDVALTGPQGSNVLKTYRLQVDAKACTRYYLSMKHSSPTATDWTPFVSGTERIGECEKRFGK